MTGLQNLRDESVASGRIDWPPGCSAPAVQRSDGQAAWQHLTVDTADPLDGHAVATATNETSEVRVSLVMVSTDMWTRRRRGFEPDHDGVDGLDLIEDWRPSRTSPSGHSFAPPKASTSSRMGGPLVAGHPS